MPDRDRLHREHRARLSRELRAEGAAAFAAGAPMVPNPHPTAWEAAQWQRGWLDGKVGAAPPAVVETAESLLRDLLASGELTPEWARRARKVLAKR